MTDERGHPPIDITNRRDRESKVVRLQPTCHLAQWWYNGRCHHPDHHYDHRGRLVYVKVDRGRR
jgi:hypothetical protein